MLYEAQSSQILRYQAVAEILKVFSSVLDALFPIVSFSLRDGETVRLVPIKYAKVFEVLNNTFCVYADEKTVQKLVQNSSHYEDFGHVFQSNQESGPYNAGVLFQEVTEQLQVESIEISFQIDVDLSGLSDIVAENYHSQQFIQGLLAGLGAGASISEEFLAHINGSNFNTSTILRDFQVLSTNSFDFSTNAKDEEVFVETIGEISVFIRNIQVVAEEFGGEDVENQMNFVFGLFYNHQILLNGIRAALQQQIDVRRYFHEMYVSGMVGGNYEESGRGLATICSILNNKNAEVLTLKQFLAVK